MTRPSFLPALLTLMLHGNGDDRIWQRCHCPLVLGQSAKATLDRVLDPLTPTSTVIIIIIILTRPRHKIIIIITGCRSCGAQHCRPAPELDLVEQFHVRNAISAIACGINERIDHPGSPAHDRSEDVDKWHLDLLVKDVGEHQRQEAQKEAQENCQHHTSQS